MRFHLPTFEASLHRDIGALAARAARTPERRTKASSEPCRQICQPLR